MPGAASNQPPVGATAPLSGASQPLQTAQSGGGSGNNRREALTNYEVDKTVRVVRGATGVVRRLNAAVVVNHRSVTDAKGKTTTQPLSEEELKKLTDLVRESVGFNQDRGDSVKVINAPFRNDVVKPVEIPFWKQPEVLDIARTLAVPAGLALIALLVFFTMIRPAMKQLMKQLVKPTPEPGENLNAMVADEIEMNSMKALVAPKKLEQLELARKLAKDNPSAVAGIVRGWIASE